MQVRSTSSNVPNSTDEATYEVAALTKQQATRQFHSAHRHVHAPLCTSRRELCLSLCSARCASMTSQGSVLACSHHFHATILYSRSMVPGYQHRITHDTCRSIDQCFAPATKQCCELREMICKSNISETTGRRPRVVALLGST